VETGFPNKTMRKSEAIMVGGMPWDMLPDYATKCNGEGGMADTVMLFAALGWYDYSGVAEQLCDYFPSSGSGQVNVEFHVGG
jgi:3,4-dihydroxyphenylacetate 2,3-dioxygenase